jgi:hypothetical protein
MRLLRTLKATRAGQEGIRKSGNRLISDCLRSPSFPRVSRCPARERRQSKQDVGRDPRADIDAGEGRQGLDERQRGNVGTRDGDGAAAEAHGWANCHVEFEKAEIV